MARVFKSKDKAIIDRKINMDKSSDLFSFHDYREYLKAWLEQAREKKSSNLTRLAEALGVHTSFLAHVLAGNKNLSFEQATELSDYLGHTHLEREYFFAILQIERAGSSKLKKYWSEKRQSIIEDRQKLGSRVGVHHELSAEDRAIFYSSWLYVAIFVSTAIEDKQTLDQIAERFHLTREKTQNILTFLVQAGICEFVKDSYRMGKSVVYLTNDSPLVVKHHTNWRMRAIQKMDTREDEEIFFTSPMSMSRQDFSRVREIFSKAIQEAHAICKDSKAEEVVCLNIDLFNPLT